MFKWLQKRNPKMARFLFSRAWKDWERRDNMIRESIELMNFCGCEECNKKTPDIDLRFDLFINGKLD